ncbi:MAG: AbgT family transporter [Clostridiaceae bacterium]
MKEQSGLKISRKSFLSSFTILFCLMVLAGILTKIIRAGTYQRIMVDGRESVVANSFQYVNPVNYPFYRWFLAPIEVLRGSDSLTIIVIILFILLIGSTFVILDKSGILKFIMESIVRKFETRKYLLMGILILFFMLFGSLFGIFEELIVLVPMAITLSYSFGWDSLVGLGISAMASGFGFAAAIFNPFTLGIAQKLAELPPYSGTAYRILIFIIIYFVLYAFLYLYAKKIESHPELSPVYDEDRSVRKKYVFEEEHSLLGNLKLKKAVKVYGIFMGLMIVTIMSGFFIEAISEITLPLVALIFFVAGITCGVISGYKTTELIKDIFKGLLSMLPPVVLILMAMSIKHIMMSGSIMDTILYRASGVIGTLSPNLAVVFLYLLILFMDFFIGSGSAKAFLIMPIVIPLTDMIGVTRQTAVLAFCFGDGFSNLLFPTNPTLMIALGLTVVSYPKWIKWSIKIQLVIFIITTAMLFAANRFGFGPF